MGTTSEKLTYLNNTKQLLKENINSLGGNLTTEPFRQYASVLEDIYERIPKVSGIGASLSLSPTMVGRIKLNEIQGDTLQDGTPTPDTPVEIQSVTGLQNVEICGKNLFDKDSGFINAYIDTSGVIHNNTNNNALFTYIKVQSNTTYTFSCNTSLKNLGINEFNSSKTFISRTQSQNVGSLTITTSSTTNYLRLQLNYDNTTTVTQEIIDSLNIQLEQGSTATSYEPYTGNTYEVNLGKNLFDKNGDFTYGSSYYETSLNAQGQIVSTSNYRVHRSAGLLIKNLFPNTNYTMSGTLVSATGTNVGNVANIEVRSDSSQITIYNILNTVTKPYDFNFTFNTGNNTSLWFSFNGLNASGDTSSLETIFDNIQLEKGSQATSYSPYFTPIELSKIGDYEDRIYKDNGKWYIEKNIGKAIIDGSSGTFSNPSTNRFNIDDLITDYKYDYNTGNFSLSNYYESYGQTGANSQFNDLVANVNYGFNFSSSTNTLRFKDTRFTNVNDFKDWLSSNNVEVLYQLATPIYEVITNTELIEQLESLYNAKSEDGTTNINVTSEDLSMLLNVGVLKGE